MTVETPNGWLRDGDCLVRDYIFTGEPEVLAFVQWVSDVANSVNHHPDIQRDGHRVRLSLTTHDAGTLTQRDYDLAKLLNNKLKY